MNHRLRNVALGVLCAAVLDACPASGPGALPCEFVDAFTETPTCIPAGVPAELTAQDCPQDAPNLCSWSSVATLAVVGTVTSVRLVRDPCVTSDDVIAGEAPASTTKGTYALEFTVTVDDVLVGTVDQVNWPPSF